MSQVANIGDLLEESGLDEKAASQFRLTVDTLGPAINAGLGTVDIDDIETAEAIVLSLVVDDSYSVEDAGNTGIVIVGVNDLLESLEEAKQATSVLITCRYLNDLPGVTDHGVLYPIRPLAGAIRLDATNFVPRGSTPLFDTIAAALAASAAKVAELEQGGVAARAVTAIITDGANNTSVQYQYANQLKPIVDGLLRTEQHIVLAIGVSDGYTDFRALFEEMGVPDRCILSPKNTKSEIRQAINVVSQSMVRASQSPGSFSQVALGGFGQ